MNANWNFPYTVRSASGEWPRWMRVTHFMRLIFRSFCGETRAIWHFNSHGSVKFSNYIKCEMALLRFAKLAEFHSIEPKLIECEFSIFFFVRCNLLYQFAFTFHVWERLFIENCVRQLFRHIGKVIHFYACWQRCKLHGTEEEQIRTKKKMKPI